jgi:alpha-tubulin suppressor-like RCC1 family protein
VSAVAQVVAGAHHTCARHKDGGVSCWGLGEALDGSGATVVAARRIPGVVKAIALAAGEYLSCAITDDDRHVRCWGNQPRTVSKEDGTPLTDVTGIALGHGFGCAANPEGVHCWGRNLRGQLARPLDLDTSEGALLAVSGPQDFLGAGESVVTYDRDHRLCAWGDNSTKVITDSNDVGLYASPQCETVPDVVELAVGSAHVCIRHSDGKMSCWGERYYGQLGIGGTGDDTADIAPRGVPSSLAAPVTGIAPGQGRTCALLQNGGQGGGQDGEQDSGVVCFGLNNLGQIGPNAPAGEEHVRSPTPVTGFSGQVVQLGAGSSAQHTCAMIDDGSVQCWGDNHAGQLGNRVVGVDPQRFSTLPISVEW